MTDLVSERQSIRLAGEDWIVDVARCPAPGKDHDAVLVTDEFVGVADGSTPLIPSRTINPREYAERALRLLARERTLPVDEMFRKALERSDRAASVELGASCTVGLARSTALGIELSLLGDCLALVAGTDAVEALEDSRLDRFDGLVADRIAAASAAGVSNPTELPAVLDQLLEHRRLANHANTYWIFAGDPAAANEVRTLTVDPDQRAILLCSDGFARLLDPLRLVDSAAELMRRAMSDGLVAMCEALRATEQEPESLSRAPRLSISDDATAVLISRQGP